MERREILAEKEKPAREEDEFRGLKALQSITSSGH
jgi:hypothetical protein